MSLRSRLAVEFPRHAASPPRAGPGPPGRVAPRLHAAAAAFIETKHIGFLFCEELDRRVFFHEAAWHRAVPPVIGEQVTFDLKPSGIAGLPDKAADVRPIVNSIGIGALAGGAR